MSNRSFVFQLVLMCSCYRYSTETSMSSQFKLPLVWFSTRCYWDTPHTPKICTINVILNVIYPYRKKSCIYWQNCCHLLKHWFYNQYPVEPSFFRVLLLFGIAYRIEPIKQVKPLTCYMVELALILLTKRFLLRIQKLILLYQKQCSKLTYNEF